MKFCNWHNIFIAQGMHYIKAAWVFVLLFFVSSISLAYEKPNLAHQRADFLAAEYALKKGNTDTFKRISQALLDYPLYPYLIKSDLRRRLFISSASEVSKFLDNYTNTPVGDQLRKAWLKKLARGKQWEQFVADYHPTQNTELQCNYRWALIQTGNPSLAFNGIESLWLAGRSQPRACDRVFDAWYGISWYQPGGMTKDLVWQRIGLAMRARKLRLARYLKRYLEPSEKPWVDLWLRVHSRPTIILSKKRFKNDHQAKNKILLHGIDRIAQSDISKAIEIWHNSISSQYPFDETERSKIERLLALKLAIRGRPESLSWLAVLEPDKSDHQISEWRVRAALNLQNWDATLAWIHQMDEELQQTRRWQYWRARALAATGHTSQADMIYTTLAKKRNYYGFLAANRLELPYQLEQQLISIEVNNIVAIGEIPGINRAHELYLLGRTVEARREWAYTTRDMNEKQLTLAAKLAQHWGWHDRAILTLARTKSRNDLELRFPLVHNQQIFAAANKYNIEPALAFAIIRQESAFTVDARSHAGALGLMQLLPRTAKQLAKRMDIKIGHSLELLDVKTNLTIGMKHFSNNLSRFDNNPVLATAAYNAGSYRVNKWMPEEGVIPSDLWAETIPIPETRNYIQNIVAYSVIYQQRLGNTYIPLENRMPPITAHGFNLPKGIDSKTTISMNTER